MGKEVSAMTTARRACGRWEGAFLCGQGAFLYEQGAFYMGKELYRWEEYSIIPSLVLYKIYINNENAF